jgi:hypothetical protein
MKLEEIVCMYCTTIGIMINVGKLIVSNMGVDDKDIRFFS